MTTFIALLRGVNVGKSRRVPMAEFRALLAGLGYTGVVTLLNSGNAVFRAAGGTSARHASDIAAALAGALKVEVAVIVKSAGELDSIIGANPIEVEAAGQSRLLVAFTQGSKALSCLKQFESLAAPPEQFAVGRNAAYLLCANGLLQSRLGEALLGKAGKSVTTRNWATTIKLQALARESNG
jgi:uncharacterized protein (DUF1697 family)